MGIKVCHAPKSYSWRVHIFYLCESTEVFCAESYKAPW